QAMSTYAGHVQATFAAGLAPNANAAAELDLLAMLLRAGFLDDVRQLATDLHVADRANADARWTHIAALLKFDAEIDALLLRTNRALMAGQAHPHFQTHVMTLAQRLQPT